VGRGEAAAVGGHCAWLAFSLQRWQTAHTTALRCAELSAADPGARGGAPGPPPPHPVGAPSWRGPTCLSGARPDPDGLRGRPQRAPPCGLRCSCASAATPAPACSCGARVSVARVRASSMIRRSRLRVPQPARVTSDQPPVHLTPAARGPGRGGGARPEGWPTSRAMRQPGPVRPAPPPARRQGGRPCTHLGEGMSMGWLERPQGDPEPTPSTATPRSAWASKSSLSELSSAEAVHLALPRLVESREEALRAWCSPLRPRHPPSRATGWKPTTVTRGCAWSHIGGRQWGADRTRCWLGRVTRTAHERSRHK